MKKLLDNTRSFKLKVDFAWKMGRKFICNDQWRLNAIGESANANILERGICYGKVFVRKGHQIQVVCIFVKK